MVNIKDTRLSEGCDIAIEFRNSSWYKDEVYEMLYNYTCGMVIQDMPNTLTNGLPMANWVTPILITRWAMR